MLFILFLLLVLFLLLGLFLLLFFPLCLHLLRVKRQRGDGSSRVPTVFRRSCMRSFSVKFHQKTHRGTLGQAVTNHHRSLRITAQIVKGIDFADRRLSEEIRAGFSAAAGLFRRLEDQIYRTVDISILFQQHCQGSQHGGMSVMAAFMRRTGILRSVRQ